MGRLTEPEIFNCLIENFRLAAERAEELAISPLKGRAYKALIGHLELIEGAARQAAHWRGDTRFLTIGMQMGHVHKIAGNWLRGIEVPGQPRVKLAASEQHPLFRKLAEVLRVALQGAVHMKDAATRQIGPILPEVLPAPTRTQGRSMPVTLPHGMIYRPSGLVIPAHADHATVQ